MGVLHCFPAGCCQPLVHLAICQQRTQSSSKYPALPPQRVVVFTISSEKKGGGFHYIFMPLQGVPFKFWGHIVTLLVPSLPSWAFWRRSFLWVAPFCACRPNPDGILLLTGGWFDHRHIYPWGGLFRFWGSLVSHAAFPPFVRWFLTIYSVGPLEENLY